MLVLPPEHPQRLLLSDEVHTRPPPALKAPSRITYVAMLIGNEARKREAEHIAELCSRFEVDWAEFQGSHFSARLGW